MIDFTGYADVLVSFVFDDLSSSVTVTFKDSTGVTTIGEIKLDQARFRPFAEALLTTAKTYYDDLSQTTQGYRMVFDVNQNSATVAFG